MVYTPCQKGFVYETPRSIDLGRLVVECGLYPVWEWNPEKRAFDYSFRPQNMRPVSEYLKLQGRFGHLHAEHVATLQKFANQQWGMMGVELPEALIQAAEAKNLADMASAEAADVTGRVFNVKGGAISVAETWMAGPGVEQEARWAADELGAVIPELVAKARPNSDGSGKPRV